MEENGAEMNVSGITGDAMVGLVCMDGIPSHGIDIRIQDMRDIGVDKIYLFTRYPIRGRADRNGIPILDSESKMLNLASSLDPSCIMLSCRYRLRPEMIKGMTLRPRMYAHLGARSPWMGSLNSFHGMGTMLEGSLAIRAEDLANAIARKTGKVPGKMYTPVPARVSAVEEMVPSSVPDTFSATGEIPEHDFIISLTSKADRTNILPISLESLINQDVPAKKIVLYLSEINFPGRSLPDHLSSYLENHPIVEVRWEKDDIKSYKKLLAVYRDYKDMDVITADDDIRYPHGWTKALLLGHMNNPGCLVGTYYHMMNVRGDLILHGSRNLTNVKKSDYVKLGTGAGIYFPAGLLECPELGDSDMFMRYAPTHDEMWVWFIAFMLGIRSVCIGFFPSFSNMCSNIIRNKSDNLSSHNSVRKSNNYLYLMSLYLRNKGVRLHRIEDPAYAEASYER